jgi:tetratricopeptide (TPR) repeat protein
MLLHDVAQEEGYPELEGYLMRAVQKFPGSTDILYACGRYLLRAGRSAEAVQCFQQVEALLKRSDLERTNKIVAQPWILFNNLASANGNLGKTEQTVKYCTLSLRANKRQENILGSFLLLLTEGNTPAEELLHILSELYDFQNPEDLLFLAKTAMAHQVPELAKEMLDRAQTLLGGETPEENQIRV